MGTDTRSEDARMLKESLGLVAPVAEQLIADFYDRLFAEYPEVRPMFPAVMDLQREKLLKAVIALVTHYDQPDALTPALTAMVKPLFAGTSKCMPAPYRCAVVLPSIVTRHSPATISIRSAAPVLK